MGILSLKDIRETLGLPEKTRHPATYLLEAADDIIYLCDDIEDGTKKGYIDWSDEYKKIKDALPLHKDNELKELFKSIDAKYIDQRMDPTEQITAHVRNFCNIVQSFLFKHAVKSFLNNYDIIMSGEPHPELELLSCNKELVATPSRHSRKLFQLQRSPFFGVGWRQGYYNAFGHLCPHFTHKHGEGLNGY